MIGQCTCYEPAGRDFLFLEGFPCCSDCLRTEGLGCGYGWVCVSVILAWLVIGFAWSGMMIYGCRARCEG